MLTENRIFRWYQKHNRAINVILQIGCEAIPGGNFVLKSLQLLGAALEDNLEQGQEEKIDEMQNMLSEIKPFILDLVEEVEDLPDFQKAPNFEQSRRVVEKSKLKIEIDSLLPKISQTLSCSIDRLSSSKKQNHRRLNNKYELVRLIGSGGQGEVYEAIHKFANIHVAIKLLPTILTQNKSNVMSLRKEYERVIRHLTHKNIVQYRDLEEDSASHQCFLVMDYIPGKNLRDVMIERKNNPFSFQEAANLLYPIAEAIDFAHENHIVHCDLKPENILIREKDQEIFLSDFGLAQEIHSTLSSYSSQSTNISGTLPYMAPEQYWGKRVEARTDLWALGIILYEMIAGIHPFRGIAFEHYMKLVCEYAPEPLPIKKWKIIEQLLSKEIDKRPKSAKKALEAKGEVDSDLEVNDSEESYYFGAKPNIYEYDFKRTLRIFIIFVHGVIAYILGSLAGGSGIALLGAGFTPALIGAAIGIGISIPLAKKMHLSEKLTKKFLRKMPKN